jgi:diguanylate cyclase (GGDEF)-like protein
MNEALLERIKSCATLPSLPTIAVQVLELAQKEEVDIAEIARIISKDPALSGKILKTVNSSFYGRAQAVSTISQSLVIMGLQSVKTLVLGFSLVSNLAKSKSKGFNHLDYWRHSIFGATAARSIASKLGIVQQEEAFLVGLLSDIGMMAFDQVLGEEYGEVVGGISSHCEVVKAELERFQLTHPQVSGIMAEQWKLPPLLATPIANHHNSAAVDDPQLKKLTEVVELAARCADVFVDKEPAAAIADVRRIARDSHGLEAGMVDVLLAEIGRKTKEIAPLFEISLGGMPSYDSILKRANEALVQMTIQTQVQAKNLQQQNEQLKQQALTDRLTGLANRAAFEQQSARIWDESQGNGTPMSVLLIDLDKFKSVNDRYGHPMGDETLRVVGNTIKQAARAQDVAARYGGEEMVLLLPDTPRSIAAVIAETLRKAIESKTIELDRVKLQITASIGVASWEPGTPLKTLSHLIKASDLALYNAKHTGRNRVRVFNPNPTPQQKAA